uniref:Uncharacterized protein n=1 Tax=viral metagenome TaxID=1070528 RepID=A0A6C0IRC0_9ZZZZ
MTDINTNTNITNITNIMDLPTDATSGGSIGGNISLMINEQPQQQMSQSNEISLDQTTISQIVNGLQQASMTGATQLPSRDLPMNTENIIKDAQIQPNYVPPPSSRDYINETDDDINNYYREERINSSLDNLYDEIQTPILLAVLYFIFQLPVVKRSAHQYLSFLCHSDGNYNINGLIFMCALFGFIYYTIFKSMKHFSKF